MAKYWLFQGNPSRWRIFDYLRDHPDEDLRDWHWSLARYREQIRPGDGAVLWLSGSDQERGVYAIGRVTEEPVEGRSDSPYWSHPADRRRVRWSARMSFEHVLLDVLILAHDLRADPRFFRASILRMPRAGNPHRLTAEEWRAIRDQLPPAARKTRQTRAR